MKEQRPAGRKWMKVWAAIHHRLNPVGGLRHLAPFWQRQVIASM